MKIKINPLEIKNTLSTIAKIPYNKSAPLESAFFIEAKNNKLIIYVDDGVLTIKKTIDKGIETSSPGKVIVNAYLFNELIQRFQAQTTIEIKDNKRLAVKSENSKNEINLLSNEYWKSNDETTTQEKIEISANDLRKICSQIAFATQTKDAQAVFQGISFRTIDNNLLITATDTTRIASKNLGPVDKNIDVLIPAKSIIETQRGLSLSDTQRIKMYISEGEVFFVFDENTKITTKTIQENFPDTEQQMKQKIQTVVICENEKLIKAIERASVITEKNKLPQTFLSIESNRFFVFSSEQSEIGYSKEEIKTLSINGANQKSCFQSRFLLEILAAYSAKEIVLEFSEQNGPLKIRAKDNTNTQHLIMPIWI